MSFPARRLSDQTASSSALDDFLTRTVVHEAAGAPMPRALIQSAFISALLTFGIGVLGVVSSSGSQGFVGTVHGLSWVAVFVGTFLLLAAIRAREARSARARVWMRCQLGVGAIVPGIVLILFALYVLYVIVVVAFLIAVIFALADGL